MSKSKEGILSYWNGKEWVRTSLSDTSYDPYYYRVGYDRIKWKKEEEQEDIVIECNLLGKEVENDQREI